MIVVVAVVAVVWLRLILSSSSCTIFFFFSFIALPLRLYPLHGMHRWCEQREHRPCVYLMERKRLGMLNAQVLDASRSKYLNCISISMHLWQSADSVEQRRRRQQIPLFPHSNDHLRRNGPLELHWTMFIFFSFINYYKFLFCFPLALAAPTVGVSRVSFSPSFSRHRYRLVFLHNL